MKGRKIMKTIYKRNRKMKERLLKKSKTKGRSKYYRKKRRNDY